MRRQYWTGGKEKLLSISKGRKRVFRKDADPQRLNCSAGDQLARRVERSLADAIAYENVSVEGMIKTFRRKVKTVLSSSNEH